MLFRGKVESDVGQVDLHPGARALPILGLRLGLRLEALGPRAVPGRGLHRAPPPSFDRGLPEEAAAQARAAVADFVGLVLVFRQGEERHPADAADGEHDVHRGGPELLFLGVNSKEKKLA